MISPPTCPICGLAVSMQAVDDSPVFPFCSQRCKQIDLLRWCRGEYAIVQDLMPPDGVDSIEDDPGEMDV